MPNQHNHCELQSLSKPITSQHRIEKESSSFFSSHRLFSLKTEPGSYFAQRTREDFKWLFDRLKEENPSVSIPRIDDGKMEQEDIEKYFKYLVEVLGQGNSKSLLFFLTSERKYFESRRQRDSTLIKDLMSKLLGAKTIDLSGMRVNETAKAEVDFSAYSSK